MRPLTVEIAPDLLSRKQIARWLLGVFEVLVLSTIVGLVSGWLGSVLAGELSRALRNDPGATFFVSVLWFVTFGLTGVWLTLRALAR